MDSKELDLSGLNYRDGIVEMSPGPADIHGHPRVFDPQTDFSSLPANAYEGKAGLAVYTEALLRSGITFVSAMPNEFYRIPNEAKDDGTEIVQFPICNRDRATLMEVSISTQSRVKMSYHLGLDPKEIIFDDRELLDSKKLQENFALAGISATALKVFGDISTGGNNVPTRHIPEIARTWFGLYPDKPVIMHLEDGNVAAVLEEIAALPEGNDIAVHIAHVSSRQELEAVIFAKERGMNVTCEATPHHLFVNTDEGSKVAGYGCMKPTLKSADDVKFLWDNMDYIDIVASDCAPHKVSEKEADSPAYGVTNHTVMMQLLFGAVEAGRISLEDVYMKTVIAPRHRFNLKHDDRTFAAFNLNRGFVKAQDIEQLVFPRYGQNIFSKLEQRLGKEFHLVGHLLQANSGLSVVRGDFEAGNHELRSTFMTDLRNLVKVNRGVV